MNPKPQAPLPGGEHVQSFDSGPQGTSPNATRVNLIAVGDGGPGPLLPRSQKPKKPKPIPALWEVARLPRWARVAFAARCARRVLPIIRKWNALAAPTVEQCEERVRSAEQAAATRDASADALSAAAYVAAFAAHAARKGARPNGAEGAARAAAECPPHELAPRDLTVTVDVATDAATAILVKSGPDDLRFIRRDFERLKRRARKERWTDDAPVPPDVFGSLWFAGWSPKWTWGTNESRG